eukprot:gene6771-biopygen3259
MTVDPTEIHQALTEHFKGWYAQPENCAQGLHITELDWGRIFTDQEYFMDHTTGTKVPEKYRTMAFHALCVEGTEVLTDALSLEFQHTPTIDEFLDVTNPTMVEMAMAYSGTKENGPYAGGPPTLDSAEEAQELKLPIHRSSWDMTKAFDTVSKNAMMIAWLRLGVPLDIALWLVELDRSGVTMVRTPAAKKAWKDRHYQGIQAPGNLYSASMRPISPNQLLSAVLAEAFDAERGTGQGDVTSPLCWTALFDILLRMLDAVDRDPFMCRGANGRLYCAGETAFADDMESTTATNTAMQTKAEVVSAFCLIFELSISPAKLRRYFQDWSRNVTASELVDMIVYTSGWQPITMNMTGYPTALLHIATDRGGLGIPRLSDLIQQDKLGAIWQGLEHTDKNLMAIQGLLERALRQGGSTTGTYGVQIQPAYKDGEMQWIRSGAEWLREDGLYLTKAQLQGCTLDSTITGSTGIRHRDNEELQKLGITTLADIYNIEDKATPAATWTLPRHLKLDYILDGLPSPETITTNYSMKAGQYWEITSGNTEIRKGTIIEIKGWDTTANSLTVGHWIQYADITMRTVLQPSGAEPSTRASASVIVINGTNWQDHPQIVLHITEGEMMMCKSAFTMEYMALAAATAIKTELQAQEPIRTDCQAVVKVLASRHYHLRQKNTTHRTLLQYATMHIDQGQCLPEHVMGHPERREPNREKWTRDQWGNHLADRAAEGDTGAFTQVVYKAITAQQLSGEMTIPGQWYLGDENTTPDDGELLQHRATARLHREYLLQRDQHRTGPEIWQTNTAGLAAQSIKAEELKRQLVSRAEGPLECLQPTEHQQAEGATPVTHRPRRDRLPEGFYDEDHRAEGGAPVLAHRSMEDPCPRDPARVHIYVSTSRLGPFKGAFARKALAAGVRIGQYTGNYTNKGTHTHYVLHDPVADIYRDAWDHTLQRVRCLAGFLNDPLDQHSANSHDELLVPYGDEYWLNNDFDVDILGKAYDEYKKEATIERWQQKIAHAKEGVAQTESTGTTMHQYPTAGPIPLQSTDRVEGTRTMPHWPWTLDDNIRRRPEMVRASVDGVMISLHVPAMSAPRAQLLNDIGNNIHDRALLGN